MKPAKKKPRGRPPMRPQERRQCIEVTLHRTTINYARAIGATVSRGIEMSVLEYWAGIQQRAKAKRKPVNQ